MPQSENDTFSIVHTQNVAMFSTVICHYHIISLKIFFAYDPCVLQHKSVIYFLLHTSYRLDQCTFDNRCNTFQRVQ